MKKQILSAALLTLGVALAITSAVAPAAAFSFESIKVDVPFDFSDGQRMYPAGKYTIRPVGVNTNPAIRIAGDDGKTSGMFLAGVGETIQPRNETALIFHRYGDQYFLFQIWTAGETTGVEIPKSSAERRIERASEAQRGESALITIAARRGMRA